MDELQVLILEPTILPGGSVRWTPWVREYVEVIEESALGGGQVKHGGELCLPARVKRPKAVERGRQDTPHHGQLLGWVNDELRMVLEQVSPHRVDTVSLG